MARFGIVGGAYQSQTQSADAQSCINLMVEKDESGAGKSDLTLVNTPGTSVFTILTDAPLRGEHTVSTPGVIPRTFAVGGSTLYEILSNGTSTPIALVANDSNPVSFASSNTQVMLASGGQGYCLTLSTTTLTGPIATIAGVSQVEYCDGFFSALIGTSAKWYVSAAADGTTWDPAQSTVISVFGDNVVSMKALARYLCFFGPKKSVCYYDSGNTFPFDVAPGGFSDQGSAATFGIGQADNTLFGIWADPLGGGVAFKVSGVTFQRVSTHAIELEWQGYSTISDAIYASYQDRGHTICQWSFPTAGKTWCYDVSTGLWHQKTFFQNGNHLAHRAQFHTYAFGKHLVGGQYSGTIYQMSSPTSDGAGGWNFVTDAGNSIVRVRRSPYVGTAGMRNYFSSLEIMGDTGLGPNIPLMDGSGNNRGPQLMVRWSDDNGHTWSDFRYLDMGQIGQYSTRMILWQLGSVWGSIGRIFELSFSDAAPLRITDADLVASPAMRPQKRLSAELRERA